MSNGPEVQTGSLSPNDLAAKLAASFGVDQAKIQSIREAQWRDATPEASGHGSADKPDVVDGNIRTEWTWHGETNALLRAAIESANDAIIITDTMLDAPGPRFEYVNPAFTAMTGYTLDEVIGKNPRILQGPRTDPNLVRRLRDDLTHGRVFHGEGINYRKDGSEYVVEWRITAMRDSDGRILKWVAVQRDVTARRRQELRRDQQLNIERAAREEAERVGRMKDEFLATLSHELRTPLNSILGWTQLLQRGRLSVDDSRRAVDTIERNARTQARLIEDLLDMSRIMAGTFRLDLRAASLQEIVEDAIENCRPDAQAKHIELVTDVDATIGPVLGDASRLQQVVWNLLTNAVKFTPPGGRVTVRITGVEPRAVELSVVDTGLGIDAAFLPFVFDRFRQADATTTRRYNGLGLGLSIVKHLVELHGGAVSATSEGPGRGSTFAVRLPLQAPVATSAPAAAPSPALNVETTADVRGVRGVRVLLVDDEDDARTFVRRLLEDAGADVDEAASAEAALHRLDQRSAPRVDVLVSDIGMPDIDGYELIRRIRQRPANDYGKLPSIALTAFARAEDRRRALLAGYQSHLAKPIDAADLLVEVQSALGRTA